MPLLINHNKVKTPVKSVGKVILAGAGCGDPELITVKAARYLQQADIVLTDRLVSDEIIRQYVRKEAEVIYVGKQCRRGFSTPQESINEMIKEYANQGKLVVRLKGGDVSLFSNILDELRVLAENNIPYEVIPGITAATGAAAYAGIPLTARGYSTAVRFLTLYKSDAVTAAYWKDLAATDDTLVFYMSSETLDEVVEKLTANHIATDKLLAVVEQATTPLQHVHTSSLDNYNKTMKGQRFISPSLVIIGKVVALHQQFAWLPNSHSKEYYFKPMGSLLHTTNTTDNKKKNVSRA
jgi:uroporphyrin-III C-methyltransferase/precorrin-2 dehydrogenase/sirohydrochlorin ferrochelatase/uroporphyrin-III C-methyltransferase